MIEIDFVLIVSVFCVGILVGFINTLSGSGSLISLPVLMFFGLDANMANGTNRISILMQTITGILAFKKQNLLDLRVCLILSIPVILGSLPGAYLGAVIDTQLLEKIIGVIFILMIFLILKNPKSWDKNIDEHILRKLKFTDFIVFFIIGFYGGFIQAGVGLFMIFALVSLMGYDLVRSNAIKLFLTMIFTPFSLIIFWQQGQINFKIGIILAIGSIIGAYIAAKVSFKSETKLIKWLVILMILFSALQFVFFR